jgi:hypothetical protein
MSGFQLGQQIQERNRMREAETATGDVIRNLYGPKPPIPMPDATSGMPQQAPARPMPTALAMPGAEAMPGPGAPPMGGPPPPVPNMPRQAPMRSAAPTAMAPDFERMQQQPGTGSSAPTPNLSWPAVLAAVAKQFPPGTKTDVMARVVDRMMPLMNSASQMEWRELQGRLSGERVRQGDDHLDQGDRRLDQGDRRLDQGDERNQLARAKLEETKRIHTARISQITQKINQAAAAAKLPPEIKANLDMQMKIFTQAATGMRTAQRSLQNAWYQGSSENRVAAQKDYDEAKATLEEAQKAMTDYAASVLPKAKLDFNIETEEPASGVRPSDFAPAKPTPGKTETLPTGEIVTTTKTGAKAQIGNAPKPGGPVAKQGPASGAEALATKPSLVKSATPSGKGAPAAKPLPPDKKMLVKGQIYLVKGVPHTFTGTGFVPVN